MAETRTFAGPLLRAAARTHPGRVRLNNEDLPVVDAARGVFGVIDGIGGHAGGEVAAAVAKDVILQRLARPFGAPAERLREAIAIANNEIFKRAGDSGELAGMACVITLAIVADDRLTIGHVGDTRLYKLRADGIRKLTRDHSPVGEREDAGELSENDAMRHPHRNEVFRDVGTIFRDKDEQEFVEIVEERLEADAAILLCSDGLSDMLPASTIAHIVRQHAGNPEQVVEALVAAANDAGGRDNITVVYAEMPLFAGEVTGGACHQRTPTEPIDGSVQPPTKDAAPSAAPARSGAFRRAARAVTASRTVWFTAGALAGVLGALALTAYVASRQLHGSQTLVVAPDGTSPLTTIGAALAAARPGDVVRVEPGVYRERVEVRDGIDLLARVPGTVTIIPPGNAGAPILTIAGALNVRVAGIRIEAGTPAEIGVRVAAPAATLELIDIAGPIRHALALSPASSVTVRGSRIAITGSLLEVPDDGHATFVSSILTRTGASSDAALSLSPSAQLVLRGNVFAGFGTAIIDGVAQAQRAELLAGNIVVPGGGR
ncbi:MAG TPA: protein phosphatase 2C domain-containing protein [Vicinamibacterales bacterium]|nr:protein phosphatase 2C domain-containing protein [Vicinamibacterales bacterium]